MNFDPRGRRTSLPSIRRWWSDRSTRTLAVSLAILLVAGAVLAVWLVVRHDSPTPARKRAGLVTAPDQIVAAAGDISTRGRDDSARTASLVQAMRPDRVITLGDNQYPDGSLQDFQRYFAKTWGRFKSMIRPAPGHHEYYTDRGARGYFTYFGAAATNPAEPNCTTGCRGYYSFDLGAWHLIALNTNHYVTRPKAVCALVACGAGSDQVRWLTADLAANTKPCLLAYWSDPRWASGTRHGSNPVIGPIWDTLYAAHADLVVNGHEHVYERFAKQDPSGRADPNGIREIISGTGGNNLYPFGSPLPRSEVRGGASHGVLKLTLRSGSYSWQFVPAEGTFTDSGTGACNAAPPGQLRMAPASFTPAAPPDLPGAVPAVLGARSRRGRRPRRPF